MEAADLAFAGLARQAELIRSGEVSPSELVELHLRRIDAIDPLLNSFRVVFAERATAEARLAEGRRGAGESRPLLGVPIAVKDNLDLAGEVTTHGSNAFGGAARRDSEIVRRLKQAGAIIIGKTHLSELAIFPWTETSAWGMTHNPWDRGRSAGGSSGGSGAAVAAGLVAAASASDGGGSIRVPAAVNGLFGLKPQRGRVSLMPDAQHWHGLSQAASVTRTVLDSALWLDAVAGPAAGDAHSAPPPDRPFADYARTVPGRLRIAVSLKPATRARVAPVVRRAVEETAELLRRLGHDVRPANPDYGLLEPIFSPRWLRGIRDDIERLPYPERLERSTRQIGGLARFVSDAALRRALAAEAPRARRMNRVLEDHDLLLTPTMPEPANPLGRYQGRSLPIAFRGASEVVAFTSPWNVTGQPAASLPAPVTDGGVPVGVQLVGRANDEGTLLSVAAQLEAEIGWPERRPPSM
jgi:amidase